jgi:Putative lumazine-binding
VRPPVAPVAALAAAALLAGCGSGPGDEQRVAATVRAFSRAAEARDYTTLCDRILAPALVSDVTSIGLPCPKALERGLGKVRDPRLSIGAITVAGDRASVEVHTSAANQKPSSDTLQLVRVHGSWRIASLAR